MFDIEMFTTFHQNVDNVFLLIKMLNCRYLDSSHVDGLLIFVIIIVEIIFLGYIY